jgi:hypothetical protein
MVKESPDIEQIGLFVCLFGCLMVFNATFNNISVISWRLSFSVPITTDVVSSNLDQGEVYNTM